MIFTEQDNINQNVRYSLKTAATHAFTFPQNQVNQSSNQSIITYHRTFRFVEAMVFPAATA